MSSGLLFVQYPNCDTCRKARKWLEAKGHSLEVRHIVEQPPSVDELREWVRMSGLPVAKFFNTSGQVYKNEGYKDKVKHASEEDMLEWLASNGMLIKRPIVIGPGGVTVGFKEDTYEQQWGSN